MKKFLLLMAMMLCVAGFAQAKKTAKVKNANPVAVYESPAQADRIICFVTDSTNALLPMATVTFSNGKTLSTSWDGRFDVTSQICSSSVKATITCAHFDTIHVTLSKDDFGKTLVFQLAHPRYVYGLATKPSATSPFHKKTSAKDVPIVETSSWSGKPCTDTISGVIVDRLGEPVIGAAICVQGTKWGTISDYDGRFTIAYPAEAKELVVKYIGMDPEVIKLKKVKTTPLRVVLKENTDRIEEVVVSGYGAARGTSSIIIRGVASITDYSEPMYAKAAPMGDLYVVEDSKIVEEADVDMPTPAPYAANAVSAGKLTAGEVNDFAKWTLWPSVLNGSHKQYIKKWGITNADRYVLQLTNTSGYPVVNSDVTLLDANGNTLFQTRTDNTGRAELWNGLVSSPAVGKLSISAEGQTIAAKPFSEGINNIRVDMPCSAPASADVFFIFDATGSMSDELHYLQAEMKDVIARSQSAVEGLSIRTGALVYRDHTDAYLTRVSRLSADIQTTQNFIDKQSALGGGDYPEAVPEAIMASISAAGWDDNARARIAFLVLDAPCHADDKTIKLLHEQILNAAAMGIRIVPVVCSGLGKDGEILMRSLALSTNGTSFFLTDDSGIGDTHLKPTTDSLKVEHLNDMMVRTIISFTRMPECVVEEILATDSTAVDSLLTIDDVERFLPNPFNPEDLDTLPTVLPQIPVSDVLIVRPNPCQGFCLVDLPLGAEALFLSDLSGKTIEAFGRFDENTSNLQVSVGSLSTGVYFVKAFYGGRWYTKKLIIR